MKTKTTNTVLDRIVHSKQKRLHEQKIRLPLAVLEKQLSQMPLEDTKDFYNSVKTRTVKPRFIAEYKRTSPSKGDLVHQKSLRQVIDAYQDAESVVAISVLTEIDYFKGSDDDLVYAISNNRHNKPILRKDFIIDEYQILQSRLLKADAFLIIASLFELDELKSLVSYGRSIGIEPLVEVHNEAELHAAVQTDTRCIGFNSRDLRTFRIDISVHELAKQLENTYARILESGIEDSDYIEYASDYGDALLIGTHFLTSDNIEDSIHELASGDKNNG